MSAAPSIDFEPTETERGMRAIKAIARALHVESRALEKSHGITLAQLDALQQLARSPVASLNELAARTGTHQSSASVVVRRLCDKGLVDRAPLATDRRRVLIVLTEAGKRLAETATPTPYARLEADLAGADPEWRMILADMLDAWLRDAGIPL